VKALPHFYLQFQASTLDETRNLIMKLAEDYLEAKSTKGIKIMKWIAGRARLVRPYEGRRR
jgi:hypothetical protein